MRLVIDGRRLTARRTGVGRYLESLLSDWSETGLPLAEAVVVLHDPAGQARVPTAPGLRAKVAGQGWPGLAWELWALGRELREDDLLFAPANLVPPGWRGPTVLVVHDLIAEARPETIPWHLRLRFNARYRRATRQATRIVVPSWATADDLQTHHGVEPERLRVVPLGPDPHFGPMSSRDGRVLAARQRVGLVGEPFFLFVGKRSRRRHVPEVVRAFEHHRQRHPDHRLVFVGPGGRAEVGRSQGVIDAGHVDEPTLQGLMADAIALLYPSEYEGFGLPVVEAMASGCPVVTLRNSALGEVGGEAACYLDSPGAGPIADAMRRLATDEPFRAALVERGLRQASRFSRARFAAQVKAVIRSLAQQVEASGRPPTRARTRAGTGAACGLP